jgi:hypothetical protein
MCLGPFAPKIPQMPPPAKPMPTMKAAVPPSEYVKPEEIKKEDDETLSTKKKKALEIEKTKKGVKEFSAIDPKSMPQSPEGGIVTPGSSPGGN